ncbi:MAG TPA: hypothetical protein VEY71_02810, partial [Chitinophagales bacterium]|nr:hypothetical protein [Chitinophagales bacterium]
LALADSFARAADMPHASLNYERVAFFSSSESERFEAVHRQAVMWLRVDSFEAALRAVQSGLAAVSNPDFVQRLWLRRVEALVRTHRFRQAEIELYNLGPADSSLMEELNFNHALVHFGLARYDSAEARFLRLLDTTVQRDRVQQLRRLIGECKNLDNASTKAMLMSMALPGLGQLYNQQYGDAINSFMLNAGLIAVAVHSAYVFGALDAVLMTGPWVARYYFGGVRNAGAHAERHAAERKAELYRQILNTLPPG